MKHQSPPRTSAAAIPAPRGRARSARCPRPSPRSTLALAAPFDAPGARPALGLAQSGSTCTRAAVAHERRAVVLDAHLRVGARAVELARHHGEPRLARHREPVGGEEGTKRVGAPLDGESAARGAERSRCRSTPSMRASSSSSASRARRVSGEARQRFAPTGKARIEKRCDRVAQVVAIHRRRGVRFVLHPCEAMRDGVRAQRGARRSRGAGGRASPSIRRACAARGIAATPFNPVPRRSCSNSVSAWSSRWCASATRGSGRAAYTA